MSTLVLMLRFAVRVISIGAIGLAACAQTYPNKPIRMVTVAPGGSADFATRLIAQGLSMSFGQQVVVENQGGASGVIAAQTLAKALPDGYTLGLFGSGIWTLPLMQSAPYDPMRDFSPITIAARSPNILVVHPSVPVKSVKELIVLAKARPGELNYAAGITGSANELAAELFKAMADVNMVRINYKGAGPALIDLVGGHVQLMFATAASVAPHLKSGRLRALAITSAAPSALAPNLPTVAASGLPGYESVAMHSIFAPAATSAPIISRLNDEIVRVLKTAVVNEKFLNAGVEVVGSTPEQLTATMKSEMVRLGKVIKGAGIRAE